MTRMLDLGVFLDTSHGSIAGGICQVEDHVKASWPFQSINIEFIDFLQNICVKTLTVAGD